MTKDSAQRRASMHWARLGTTFATIRHKSVTDRFEVGYWNKERVVLGAGPTWEIAFERALKPRTETSTTPVEALPTEMQPAPPSRAPREEAVVLYHKKTAHAEANAPETNLWVIRVLAKGQRFSDARLPGYIAAYYSNDTSSWWLLKASAVDRLAHELLNGKDNEPATQRAALQQWEEQVSSGDEMLELSWREALDYKLPSGGVIEQEAVKQPVRAAKTPQT